MPNCPRCETEVQAEDTFCRQCGGALREEACDSRTRFMDEMAAGHQRRLKQRADDPDALYNVALTLLHSERYAEAAGKLALVAQLLPDFLDARLKLAVALWNSGRHQDALAAIEQALEQSPDHAKARQLRAQMVQHLPAPQ